MFADDMVVMSESEEQLHTGLNNLCNYCKKWGITVNTSKTKVFVFKKRS